MLTPSDSRNCGTAGKAEAMNITDRIRAATIHMRFHRAQTQVNTKAPHENLSGKKIASAAVASFGLAYME